MRLGHPFVFLARIRSVTHDVLLPLEAELLVPTHKVSAQRLRYYGKGLSQQHCSAAVLHRRVPRVQALNLEPTQMRFTPEEEKA